MAFSGARVFNSADITLTGFDTLTFDSERFDTDSYHSTSSNTSRLTVPTTGYYGIGASIYLSFAGGDNLIEELSLILLHQGGTLIAATGFSCLNLTYNIGLDTYFGNVNTVYQMTAGQFVEVRITYVEQGAANTVKAVRFGNFSPEFWINRLGT